MIRTWAHDIYESPFVLQLKKKNPLSVTSLISKIIIKSETNIYSVWVFVG